MQVDGIGKNGKASKKAILTIDNNTLELPIMEGTEGPAVIDVSKLYTATGYFTYDNGFMSTASCTSKITYIDGENGILRHRGYDIADLAEKSDFESVAYLLLYGELPDRNQKEDFLAK